MIYFLLFYRFFIIGLLAVGGGAATIPFLFDLAQKYDWFTRADVIGMIAVSEATPGPMGVNMATFAGFQSAGFLGGICATLGLVLPSVLIVIALIKLVHRFACDKLLYDLLKPVRPAVVALILNATLEIAGIGIKNMTDAMVFCFILLLMRFYKASPIFYIIAGGVLGYTLRL